MRRFLIYPLILLLACDLGGVEIGETSSFIKFFDEGNGVAMEQASSGLILVGTITGDDNQTILTKVDNNGNIEWVERYDDFVGNAVKVIANDGGYIIVGDRINDTGGDPVTAMAIIKTNSSGQIASANTDSVSFNSQNFPNGPLPSQTDFHGISTTFDTDGNLLVLGTFEDDQDLDQIIITKIDITNLAQAPIWWQEYGENQRNSDASKSIHLNSSGNIVWSGSVFTVSEQTVETSLRSYVAVPDSEPTNVQTRGDDPNDLNYGAADIQPTQTGFGIIGTISGNDPALTVQPTSIVLVRIDENGTIINGSERTYEIVDNSVAVGNSLFATIDGGLILLGTRQTVTVGTDVLGNGENDFFLIKTDESGNIEWTQAIGGGGSEEGAVVRQAADGSYFIFGTSTSFGTSRMTLVKTTSLGEIN